VNKIPADSDYNKEAHSKYDEFEHRFSEAMVKKGQGFASSGKCKELQMLITQARSSVIVSALRRIPCTESGGNVVVRQGSGTPPGPGSAVVPPSACTPADIDGYKAKGQQEVSAGQAPAALREYEKANNCKFDTHVVSLIVLTACMAGNSSKAKSYYAKCGPACNSLVARCQTFNINLP
jgi:hypothetical protein